MSAVNVALAFTGTKRPTRNWTPRVSVRSLALPPIIGIRQEKSLVCRVRFPFTSQRNSV